MPVFKPMSLIRVSLQAALSTQINSAMYSQKTCGIRLADFAKTRLFWISLMKLGAPLYCYLSYDSLLHRKIRH